MYIIKILLFYLTYVNPWITTPVTFKGSLPPGGDGKHLPPGGDGKCWGGAGGNRKNETNLVLRNKFGLAGV